MIASLRTHRGRAALILTESDFDVDQIVGITNLNISDPKALAKLAKQWCGPDFAARVGPGDVIIAGPNFGYGHPHFPAMIAMREIGIAGVIAQSFSPPYWMGEILQGFPQLSCPDVLQGVDLWDDLEIDWLGARIINHSKGVTLYGDELSEGDRSLLVSGGLLNKLKPAAV
jgi:3-isopropylmalate/(R)-2-methylmalate dehydratase small subunit